MTELQRQPLRVQLKDLLLERILDGELAPGEQIDLGALADEWEISRTPLREALFTLEEEGLVTSKRGKGFFVWKLSAREAVNLYQIAGGLERIAVRTTETVDPEALRRMREANARLLEVQGHPAKMIQWDSEVHHEFVSGSSNEDLLELITKIRNRLHRYRFYGYEYVVTHETDEKRTSVDEHDAVIDSLEAGELERAADLLEKHWQRGTMLVHQWLRNPENGPDYGS